MKVYVARYHGGGCDPEWDAVNVTLDPVPSYYGVDGQDPNPLADETEAYRVMDGDVALGDTVWTVRERTARCCGSGSLIFAVYTTKAAADTAAAHLNHVGGRPPLTDSEWEHYGEYGWRDAPALYRVAEARVVALDSDEIDR